MPLALGAATEALSAMLNQEPHIRCLSCGLFWPREEMANLAECKECQSRDRDREAERDYTRYCGCI